MNAHNLNLVLHGLVVAAVLSAAMGCADSSNGGGGTDAAGGGQVQGDTGADADDASSANSEGPASGQSDAAGGVESDTDAALATPGDADQNEERDQDSPAAPDVGEAEADTSVAGPLAGWCTTEDPKFSFFVTSMVSLWTLAGDPLSDWSGGFGGNFGGIAGADNICQQIGAAVGHGHRTWRAFLSATDDGNGAPVHAIERIGTGPWYDANGRLVSNDIAGLLGERPAGDAATINDLPDECGLPITLTGDAHDILTGSNKQGRLHSTDADSTCHDWTSSDGNVGSAASGGGPGGPGGGAKPKSVMCGHSFPRQGGGGMGGKNWMSDHGVRGCGKGANLLNNGPGSGTCVGCAGGYGGLYCFAL